MTIRKRNKELLEQKKELAHLQQNCITLLERIDDAHRNGKVLLLEDMTESLVNQLIALARDDKTIILYSKDGHRIEIHEKDESQPKRKRNLF